MSFYYELGDVSSGATVLSVAAALDGQLFHPLPEASRQVPLLRLVNRLPNGLIRRIVERSSRQRGHDPRMASSLSSDDLAEWNVRAYDYLPADRRFDVIVLGAPSGAAAYIASALDAPFLSHTFVASFRSPGHPDDIEGYQRRGEEIITPILSRNPDLHVINHYDPVHDRFLVGQVNHVRMKLLDLPLSYRHFIEERLAPGGHLIVLNCHAQWGQYEIRPRYTFQVGGLGEISDRDFVRGSAQLERWLEEEGSPNRRGWKLPLRWAPHPESEWGSQPEFGEAVSAFASERDVHFYTADFGSVEEISRLAFYTWQWLNFLLGQSPEAVLVDGFIQMNPLAPRLSRLLPLWLPFNCLDSRRFLQSMVSEFPEDAPILLQPWPSFSPGPDIAESRDWNRTLLGRRGRWLGSSADRYPYDLASVGAMTTVLDDWLKRHASPLPRSLHPEEFLELLRILESVSMPEILRSERN